MEILKGGEQESRHQVFKRTGCPKLPFMALTAHSASAQFHATMHGIVRGV